MSDYSSVCVCVCVCVYVCVCVPIRSEPINFEFTYYSLPHFLLIIVC